MIRFSLKSLLKKTLSLAGSSRARLLLGVALAVALVARIFLPLVMSNSNHREIPDIGKTPIVQSQESNREALALHVRGNLLVTHDGRSVLLRGVDRDGSDFLCAEGHGIIDGPTGQHSIEALLSWDINTVRIPLNEACWLGAPGLAPQYSGITYQNAIAAYTQALTGQGIYVILDLHKNGPGTAVDTHTIVPMPDADHSVTFWQQVASRFKDNGMVLFDLFNEPHSVSWQCLRDGGLCAGVSYRTVGMQTLVRTIRATGAANVLIVGGLHWTNDLSQWLKYAPQDPLHNLAASWHVYVLNSPCRTVACYTQTLAPVAAQVPLIVGEFGVDEAGISCAPRGMDGVAELLNWLDKSQASYLAFSWNVGKQTCGSLSLISDYAGTPHAPNGTAYKAHLLALAALASSSPISPARGRAP